MSHKKQPSEDGIPEELYYMPLLVKDFLSSPSVQAMNAEEIGAYMLVLMHCWASGKCRVSRADICAGSLIRCGRNRARVAEKILRCFRDDEEPGYVTNDKLQEVWAESVAKFQAASERGRSAAFKRWGKNAPGNARALQTDTKNGCPGNANTNNKDLPTEDHIPLPPSGGRKTLRSREDCEQVVKAFCALGLSEPELTDSRLATIRTRFSQNPEFLDEWNGALVKVRASDWLMGRGGPWKVTLDWLLKPANFTKVKEGNYDKGKRGASSPSKGILQFASDTYDPDRRATHREEDY